MLGQQLPRSAESYTVAQRRIIAAAGRDVRRRWGRLSGSALDESFAALLPGLVRSVTSAQASIAEGALAYVPAVLAETGQATVAFAAPNAAPLLGRTGDGRTVEGLLELGKVRVKEAIGQGVSVDVALASSRSWASLVVSTTLSDTGRQAESLGMGVRSVTGYVRMLNPPSCSRCAILAGRWYRKNQGFQRHPGCDCRHIPASESVAGDLTVDTRAYFDGLSAAEQERIFTVDGAKAIREGADINQIVNARRGMTTAQTPTGRRLLVRDANGNYVTAEGTTRRGYAQAVTGRGRGFTRLMPESIAEIARNDSDLYRRLLQANGYI